MTLTFDVSRRMLDAAISKSISSQLKPIAVSILDIRGCLKASIAQDGISLLRERIAHGKAYGALALGIGSRSIFKRAEEQAYFVSAVNALAGGSVIPVPGGVLIRDDAGEIIGAIGVSGDTSDNDELCAIAAISAVGLVADPG